MPWTCQFYFFVDQCAMITQDLVFKNTISILLQAIRMDKNEQVSVHVYYIDRSCTTESDYSKQKAYVFLMFIEVTIDICISLDFLSFFIDE